MERRLLLRGAAIVTCDPAVGDLQRGDILIEGDIVRAVAPELGPMDCEVIDLTGKILIPGLIDSHRHTWQTALRGLGADWTVLDYLAGVRVKLAPAYSPEDVYVANVAGALEALDMGITTLVDFSHCIHSPAHADAAVDGLESAGIRALFCYGFADYGAGSAFADHAARVRYGRALHDARFVRRPSSLVQFGVALTEMQIPWELSRAELSLARDLDLPVTLHCASWSVPGVSEVQRMLAEDFLTPRVLAVHATHCSDDDLRALAEHGASVCATPETELQMGMGVPVISRALSARVRTTLGCDVVCSNNGDPFALMRLALQVSRGSDNAGGGLPLRLRFSARDALRMMTCSAAEALGFDHVGSLRPGKQADLVVLGGDTLNLVPPALGALVTQAHAGNVQDVMVAGRFVKREGKLVDADLSALKARLLASRHSLLERVGGEPGLLSDRAELLRAWNLGQAAAESPSAT